MAQTDLQEINDYWVKKYPRVAITLYPRFSNGDYCGKMSTYNSSFDLQANTIGELINQGESFLRKVIHE